jgi:hypothetical protein
VISTLQPSVTTSLFLRSNASIFPARAPLYNSAHLRFAHDLSMGNVAVCNISGHRPS